MRPATHRKFQPVQPTTDRLQGFHQDAHEALSRTISEFIKLDDEPVDTTRWRFVRSDGNVSAYYDRRSLHAQSTSLLVAGTLNAHLDDVMEGLYMDNSKDARMVLSELSPRFIDAEVLQTFEKRSGKQPAAFTGLKWALVKLSSTGINSSRDMCYMEKLGTINIFGGRKLGYFIVQSVDLPECPRILSSRVIRAHVSMCYLFEELEEGTVGIYMRGSTACQSSRILRKLSRRSFAGLSLSFVNAVDVAYAKRYAHLVETKQSSAISMSSSTVCDVCECSPSFFGRLQECSGCNKLKVCKRCRIKKNILRCGDSVPNRLSLTTFCLDCVSHVRQARLLRRAPDDEDSTHELGSESGWRTSLSSLMDDDSDSSQESLNKFSRTLRRQLDDSGFIQLDASLRLSALQSIGAGPVQHDYMTNNDSEDDNGSVDDGFLSLDSPQAVGSGYYEDNEEASQIESIEPLRCSLQPPEMLEAQELDCNGRPRKHLYAKSFSEATAAELQRHLLSQLVKASKQTQRLTRAQAALVQHYMTGTSNSVC